MRLEQLSGIAVIALVGMTGAASADVMYGPETETCGGAVTCSITVQVPATAYTEPSPLPFTLVDLGTGASLTGSTTTLNQINTPGLIPAGITSISFTGGTPASGLYSGNTVDMNLSPFGSTTIGGVPQDSSTPTENYLVAGDSGGTVTINYAANQTAFDLLWGTLDESNQNTLIYTLMMGNMTVAQLTGATIQAAITAAHGPTLANGEFDVAVQIAGLPSFNQIMAEDNSSDHPAFEFVPGIVPAPPIGHGLAAVLAVCGGLFGFKLWERSKKRRALGIATPLAAA
jgi:hypothetical protein